MGFRVPMLMLLDSKALFDVLTSNKKTTEQRLMIDLSIAREAYLKGEIDDVGLIRSQDNYSDDLSKLRGNGKLSEFLRSGRVEWMGKICNFIIRPQ